MADLKQALIWLADGMKIRYYGWPHDYYRYIDNGVLEDAHGNKKESSDWYFPSHGWELYEEPKPIPPPEYDEREVRLVNPVKDMEDYIVWDKNGRYTIAVWCSDDKCFYDRGGFGFSLDVVEYKPLPNRDEK